ncbi:MAG: stage III sporulation protein AC [Clostridia bacterium]|nr:stage III sporulation protein AC [Clostridia bacterium]
MQIDLIFKIAAIGILLAVINQVLTKADKSEIATLVTLSGVVIVLLMVVDLISQLFSTVKALFGL